MRRRRRSTYLLAREIDLLPCLFNRLASSLDQPVQQLFFLSVASNQLKPISFTILFLLLYELILKDMVPAAAAEAAAEAATACWTPKPWEPSDSDQGFCCSCQYRWNGQKERISFFQKTNSNHDNNIDTFICAQFSMSFSCIDIDHVHLFRSSSIGILKRRSLFFLCRASWSSI